MMRSVTPHDAVLYVGRTQGHRSRTSSLVTILGRSFGFLSISLRDGRRLYVVLPAEARPQIFVLFLLPAPPPGAYLWLVQGHA